MAERITESSSSITACVTGASGMIGRKIVSLLLKQGFTVKVLSRSGTFADDRVIIVKGDLGDDVALELFLENGDMLFHCAAELHDEAKMWQVNVEGTKRLLTKMKAGKLKYLCFISSAGVVGTTNKKLVDEQTSCNPRNEYERSKWEAEKFVSAGINNCSVVSLRPTNVIDDESPGAFALPIRNSILDMFKLFLKGGECAHIVHAEDVAAAALFFVNRKHQSPACYFVSRDEEPINTFSDIWGVSKTVQSGETADKYPSFLHLPLVVPYFVRKVLKGSCNMGNVKYSAKKLLATGFKFDKTIPEMALRLVNSTHND